MTMQTIAAAMQRVESVFQRRPEAGLADDTPATAHWESGTRVVSRHPNGTQVVTDMPSEIGGSGDQVTPGWLLRAALASCAATRIAMAAAAAGVELTTLDVAASSRSDARGLLGMVNADGQPVPAEPRCTACSAHRGARHRRDAPARAGRAKPWLFACHCRAPGRGAGGLAHRGCRGLMDAG